MKKRALALLVLMPAALGCSIAALLMSKQPEPLTGPVSQHLLQEGRQQVLTLDIDLEDMSRVTDANGDAPQRPSRSLPTTVWYPADGGHYPLIVSSHGFSSMRTGLIMSKLPEVMSVSFFPSRLTR